jgi:hypothetical protein
MEVKVPCGGICQNGHGDRTGTLEICRNLAYKKCERDINNIKSYLLHFHQGKRIEIFKRIIVALTWLIKSNYFTHAQKWTRALAKKIIKIWARRFVVAAIEGYLKF